MEYEITYCTKVSAIFAKSLVKSGDLSEKIAYLQDQGYVIVSVEGYSE